MGARGGGTQFVAIAIVYRKNSRLWELPPASCVSRRASRVLRRAFCVVRPGTSKQSRNRSVLPCAGFSPPAVRDSRLDSSIQNRTRTRGRVLHSVSVVRTSTIVDDNRTRARAYARASVFITYPLPDSDATDPSQSAWTRTVGRPQPQPRPRPLPPVPPAGRFERASKV